MTAPSASPLLRDGVAGDAKAIGDLMARHLQSRLVDLGPRFLNGLCRFMLESPYVVCRVAEVEGKARGFVLGITDTGAFYRSFLLRRGIQSVWAALPYLFSLRAIKTGLNGLNYFNRTPHQDPPADLVAFVVGEGLQGQGVGGRLFDEAVERLHQRGATAFKVTTPTDNAGANRFYRRRGARLIRVEPFNEDVDTNVYYVDLKDT
jgi:ribosomal protein S18 acetylase RimI-like enzyme